MHHELLPITFNNDPHSKALESVCLPQFHTRPVTTQSLDMGPGSLGQGSGIRPMPMTLSSSVRLFWVRANDVGGISRHQGLGSRGHFESQSPL